MEPKLESDDSDLRRLREGGVEMLSEVFARHEMRLKSLVKTRLDSRLARHLDPSDVVQELFIKASREVDTFLPDAKVSVYIWLRRLLQNRIIDFARHFSASKRKPGEGIRQLGLTDSSLLIATSLTSPSEAAQKREDSERLVEALSSLSEEDQEVLLLRHYECMRNQDVSYVLGLTPAAASNRYIRALEKLKRALDE